MIEVEIRAAVPATRELEVIVVPWLETYANGDGWWEAAAGAWLERQPGAGAGSAGWAGLGSPDRPDLYVVHPHEGESRATAFRSAAGAGARAARERGARSVGVVMLAGADDQIWQAAAEGLALGDWRYDGLRDAEDLRTAPAERALCASAPEDPSARRQAADRGLALAAAQNAARELVTLPGNALTPTALAERTARLGEEHGFAVESWGRERLREEGFGALLAVAQGSAEEPMFLILEHEGEGGDPVVVVGKGVTFDAGGISLKPPAGMEDMKYDMSGAAAAVGVLVAAARLGIRERVIGLVPATENLPSGTAIKPGDVIRGLSGRTIEVINTDAEGRLILSDALTYAQRLAPAAIIDLATLTGACVIALGHHAVGLLSPHDDLAVELVDAGLASGERVWRLPLWREYRKQLDSEIADIKNTGGRPAGTITAACFLREFVDDGVPWAHLDIAGTAWADEARGWQPKGATGVGVRLLLQWLRNRD